MSSDDFFDDELDSAILKEVDAIEAAAIADFSSRNEKINPPSTVGQQQRTRSTPVVIDLSDSEEFGSFALDDAQLQQIDRICAHHFSNSRDKPVASSSRIGLAQRSSSKCSLQTTLFGEILQPGVTVPKKTFQRTHSKAPPREERRTKQWDHTAFAKTGWRAAGKRKGLFDGEDEENHEDEIEFEQFPAPIVSIE